MMKHEETARGNLRFGKCGVADIVDAILQ